VCAQSGVIPGGPQGQQGDPAAAWRHWSIPFPTPATPPGMTRDCRGVRLTCMVLAGLALPLARAAGQKHTAYRPGTTQYAAAMVSRGYECGLRVERGRMVAVHQGDERRRMIAANQDFALRSYNLPRACTEAERAAVASALRAMSRR
jgi:hypothetical protein